MQVFERQMERTSDEKGVRPSDCSAETIIQSFSEATSRKYVQQSVSS